MKKLATATCPIQPVGKYLFVKRLASMTKTEGGLFIPDDAQEKPQYGKVLAIGNDVDGQLIPLNSLVVFGKYAGADIDILKDEPLVMLEKDEVVGVVVDAQLIKDLTS
jgi:chaperonin GroES